MKTKVLAGLCGVLLVATGCVSTVTGDRTAAVPFIKDTFEGRYKETPENVWKAAREVVKDNGVLTKEGTNYTGTNEVRVIQGKVNERLIWVRVMPVDAEVTSVAVQARTLGGSPDPNLTHQLEKEIAIKLATGR